MREASPPPHPPSAHPMMPHARPVRLLSVRCCLLLLASLQLATVAAAAAQQAAAPSHWNRSLEQEAEWYGSEEAVRIADNLLVYQHPNGGWGKNVDMAKPLTAAERATIREGMPRLETMIDNGATFTQLRYLARVYDATRNARFRESFLRGMDYLLEAQYDNGGWPQIYPIRKGYYEHVTFNDGAMIGVMSLLRDAARGEAPFGFVDAERRRLASAAIEKGLEVILRSQVVVNGKRTAWGAQHDRFDLRPQQARSYELPSLSGMESVGIVRYLMEIEEPSPEVVAAVIAAAEWLESVKLTGIAVVNRPDPSLPRGYDRVVVSDPSAEPLWARFYEIGSNRPMFVGRDGVVKDSLADIEHERRVGYSYLGPYAGKLLEEEFPAWRRRF